MYFYQKKLFFINYANLKYLYLYKLVETFTFLSYFFMRNILSPSSNFYLYFENLSFLTNLLICTPLNEQNSFTECLEILYTHLRCFDIIFVQITKRQKTFFFFGPAQYIYPFHNLDLNNHCLIEILNLLISDLINLCRLSKTRMMVIIQHSLRREK